MRFERLNHFGGRRSLSLGTRKGHCVPSWHYKADDPSIQSFVCPNTRLLQVKCVIGFYGESCLHLLLNSCPTLDHWLKPIMKRMWPRKQKTATKSLAEQTFPAIGCTITPQLCKARNRTIDMPVISVSQNEVVLHCAPKRRKVPEQQHL